MSSVVIPVYCSVTSCRKIAKIDGKDCKNHPYHVCSRECETKIRTFRANLYAEGAKLAQYWKDNWQKYAKHAKFTR